VTGGGLITVLLACGLMVVLALLMAWDFKRMNKRWADEDEREERAGQSWNS
jgi:hypothetical protein